MDKLCIFFVLAILANQAVGMSFREKRQTNTDDDLEDRYGWDRPWFPGSQFPGQGQFPGQQQQLQQRPLRPQRPQRPQQPQPQQPQQPQQPEQPQQPTPSPTGSTTMSPAIQECIRNCPVTSEFNPVCGTDRVQYSNPGRLGCAQACGINVTLLRSAPCPPATPAPAS